MENIPDQARISVIISDAQSNACFASLSNQHSGVSFCNVVI